MLRRKGCPISPQSCPREEKKNKKAAKGILFLKGKSYLCTHKRYKKASMN